MRVVAVSQDVVVLNKCDLLAVAPGGGLGALSDMEDELARRAPGVRVVRARYGEVRYGAGLCTPAHQHIGIGNSIPDMQCGRMPMCSGMACYSWCMSYISRARAGVAPSCQPAALTFCQLRRLSSLGQGAPLHAGRLPLPTLLGLRTCPCPCMLQVPLPTVLDVEPVEGARSGSIAAAAAAAGAAGDGVGGGFMSHESMPVGAAGGFRLSAGALGWRGTGKTGSHRGKESKMHVRRCPYTPGMLVLSDERGLRLSEASGPGRSAFCAWGSERRAGWWALPYARPLRVWPNPGWRTAVAPRCCNGDAVSSGVQLRLAWWAPTTLPKRILVLKRRCYPCVHCGGVNVNNSSTVHVSLAAEVHPPRCRSPGGWRPGGGQLPAHAAASCATGRRGRARRTRGGAQPPSRTPPRTHARPRPRPRPAAQRLPHRVSSGGGGPCVPRGRGALRAAACCAGARWGASPLALVISPLLLSPLIAVRPSMLVWVAAML